MSTLFETGWETSALFGGADNIFRYRLSRVWDKSLAKLLFCMLNPSTATAEKSDPTVTRCIDFAKRLGYGGLEVTNIFAYRSTEPDALYPPGPGGVWGDVWDPTGPDNDFHIAAARKECGMVICAWGRHGALMNRGEKVRELLRALGPVHCLKLNRDGTPGHPLYIPAVTVPILF